jgi:hypothetical protein
MLSSAAAGGQGGGQQQWVKHPETLVHIIPFMSLCVILQLLVDAVADRAGTALQIKAKHVCNSNYLAYDIVVFVIRTGVPVVT